MSSTINGKTSLILMHIAVWALLFILPYTFSLDTGLKLEHVIIHSWSSVISMAAIFYINYFVLIHRFLFKNKVWVFLILNFIIIASFVLLRFQLIQAFSPGRPKGDGPGYSYMLYLDFIYFIIPLAMAVALTSLNRFFRLRVLQKENENEKLQSELQNLKYQLQPHFFFNSLNNIYSLVDIDVEKAKENIHSLSKLMRIMLYESNLNEVPLSQEIEFLNRFNDLMKLRLNSHITVKTDFSEINPDVKIAPHLFISLVENAYKHGVSATEESVISFKIKGDESFVEFTSTNGNFPKKDSDKSGSGIGLENLKKRLQLTYPNQHEFRTFVENGIFTAQLKVHLESN